MNWPVIDQDYGKEEATAVCPCGWRQEFKTYEAALLALNHHDCAATADTEAVDRWED